ncbi:low temperature requirement protein A [Streptomyces violarus]|uniref:low temperature requirement protein A n=1 Tax=Streptomyces violarus TaxID=67380 RepID=UPI0021BEA3C9|nr:low temperature requirement protein A [Streptomyces violarus]MCT9138574.1 low temperature requirement protein A [Streptomyces violarus]
MDPRTRRMLLTVMLLGPFMNAAIPRAFGDAGRVFVVTFLMIHLGRTVWLLRVGLDRRNQEHWRRVLVWFPVAAPFWLTGAAVDGAARRPQPGRPAYRTGYTPGCGTVVERTMSRGAS